MSDLIDRQAVIDLLKQMRKDGDMVPWEGKDVFARIRKLPTIQPEKAKLSHEGTTSDLISRMETVEHLRRVLDATVPITDYDEGYVDGVEFGISTMSTMPTIQPQSTAQSTNLIDRRATIDAVNNAFDRETLLTGLVRSIAVRAIRDMPSAQPEPQWIPVEKELPEPRIDVWVNSDLGQMVGYYDEMVNTWYGRDYLELIVNAWMPLPEAYKPNK